MWKKKDRVEFVRLGENVPRAERRAQRLGHENLMDAMHNSMTGVSRSVRNGNWDAAEENAEVLVVIVRELRRRG